MSDVTLTSAVRSNLLALQSTQGLVNRTQSRLSTGLKVGSAIDDPVAYFQSKALSDRASDFQGKKDNIDQGVSSLSTALQGISGVSTLVKQLKGLALNAQSASSSQIGSLVQQFNALRSQLDNLALDSQYQGQNLVAGKGQTLTVSFSNLTGSTLEVTSVDVRVGATGLNIAKAVTSNGGFQLSFDDASGAALGTEGVVKATYAGTATALTSGTYTFSYGSATVSFTVYSAGGTTGANADVEAFTTTSVLANGQDFNFRATTAGDTDELNVTQGSIQNNNHFAVEYHASTGGGVSGLAGGDSLNFVMNGLTGNSLASGNYTFSFGGYNMTFTVASAGDVTAGTFTTTNTFVNGTFGTAGGVTANTLALTLSTGTGTKENVVTFTAAVSSLGATSGPYKGQAYYSAGGISGAYGFQISAETKVGYVSGQYVLDSKLTGVVQNLVTQLDANLQVLRSHAQNLGTNVALLNTRLDFTKNYVDLLQSGSGKLTLADLNEEGANLLALQTRQQLGIQALSFAGQNEKSILSLFR
ncbi:flagellin [Paramagnetospirillum magneticum]|uniref:Flagellin and related hook-associated protein n=1 Tax=Paramagnetospirillum magneticum (strain ATCC 700264 / AMB-1) TaxID=342108 RepID=Q2W9I7_PARM1|nr:flagellin [Paramagnetospirillum magneticum]BAE49488.1 Flagellin and related hook-associated protein [Paramagnetospirillum magneticum AMB-1]